MFFKKGSKVEDVPRGRVRQVQRAPQLDVTAPAIVAQLHTGEGVDREGLIRRLGTIGMERAKLAAAQRACANCAPVIAVLKAQETAVDPIRVLNTLWRQCPEMRLNSRNDTIVTSAMKYEIMEGVLFRRIYEVRADEVQ